jgi:hypothetical protein
MCSPRQLVRKMAHQKMYVHLVAIFILQIVTNRNEYQESSHMLQFLSLFNFLLTFLIILSFYASIFLLHIILEPELLILFLLIDLSGNDQEGATQFTVEV